MSIPIPVWVMGADNGVVGRIGSNFRQLAQLELQFSQGPRNAFSLSCSRRHDSQNPKRFLRILSSEKLKFVSNNKLAGLANGKDSQIEYVSIATLQVQFFVGVLGTSVFSIILGGNLFAVMDRSLLNGQLNIGEDTDDMYKDLFAKYGKVVLERKGQKSPSAEVDADAESLSFAVAMAKVASDVKAANIRVLFVKPLVYWTRFFIITTAFSLPQVDAIGSRIRDLAEKKYGKIPTGDAKPKSWTLLDFGDVVVHIFLPQQRAFYNLEEFYGNAPRIELPFENEPPFRG